MMDILEQARMRTQLDNGYIYTILSQLDGLEVQKANELLHKVQLMLTVTQGSINMVRMTQAWFPEIAAANKKARRTNDFTSAGHQYQCIGYTEQLYLYRRVGVWYGHLFPNQCLYYSLATNSSRQLRRLTKTNILNDFRITRYETVLVDFLKHHSVYKKNPMTNTLVLLEVLNTQKIVHKLI